MFIIDAIIRPINEVNATQKLRFPPNLACNPKFIESNDPFPILLFAIKATPNVKIIIPSKNMLYLFILYIFPPPLLFLLTHTYI